MDAVNYIEKVKDVLDYNENRNDEDGANGPEGFNSMF
jgi:hypothetical protein